MRHLTISTLGLAVSLVLAGCSGNPAPNRSTSEVARGGRIWAGTCNRCHNLRPPAQFTAEQWPIIVSHMRARADLTRQQAEAVAAYLEQVAGEASS